MVRGGTPPLVQGDGDIESWCQREGTRGGAFALVGVDALADVAIAVPNLTRIEPVYWGENDAYIVVGTRALLVHCVLSGERLPRYDLDSLASFLAGGFFAGEDIPFRGVRLAPADMAVVVERGKVRLTPTTDVLQNVSTEEPSNETYDELASAFQGSFDPLRGAGQAIQVGLTGGKDSRLLCAGLKAAGVPFSTFIVDYGAANAADVHASSLVARAMGVEHDVRSRSGRAQSTRHVQSVDLLQRVRDTLFVTDGMLSGYENVPRRRGRYSTTLNLGGNGGELLRGGYAKSYKANSREDVRSVLVSNFGRFNEYVRAEHAAKHAAFLEDWIDEQPADLGPPALLDRFYLFYRCGRWSAAARAGMGTCQDMFQPLFDNRLIGTVQSLPLEPRLDDRLVYEMLRRLVPEVAGIPLAHGHWLFTSPEERAAERQAYPQLYEKPETSRAKGPNLDWRTRFATQLRDEFELQIFRGPAADQLFDVLDRDRLRQLFESEDMRNPANRVFLFAVYTLSVLLSNEWLEEHSVGRAIEVDTVLP